ncbi:MAG: primosomal protein N' [Fusobacteria bacterium]|nr:primosomal protein N' [Fusobacteriota bacterium]
MHYYNLYIEDISHMLFTYGSENNDYKIGEQVIVKFQNKTRKAIIMGYSQQTEFDYTVNEIQGKIENSIKIDEIHLKLYIWIRNYYITNFSNIITGVLPKNMRNEMVSRCKLNKIFIPRNKNDKIFLDYMKVKKNISLDTLKRKFDKSLIDYMIAENILKLEKVIRDKRKKVIKHIILENEYNKKIKLTNEQENTKNSIINSSKKLFLVKGVTGSGKTEIYIEIIKEANRNNQGAIFLVPEISLTPQIIKRFEETFGNKIAILHSKLTDREKADEWNHVNNGEKKIIVGVRSAIFAPVKNLKYIIIDEEHETTYKQDSNFVYDARYVAIKRSELEDLKVIFGTATPLIESFYYGKNNIFEYLELNRRYNNITPPKFEIVDMKNEERENFSEKLLKEISNCIKNNEQVILFLNKKGYSNQIQCKKCGHIEKCENCSVSYSYYKIENKLKCSYCGKEKKFTKICADCNSDEFSYHNYGTEKIEMELQEIFPEARILRIDSDTVKERDAYTNMYNDFLSQKYDILLGTQIIAKGFHFPNVTLAGIISADTILNFPDFRSSEKTFQLIVQTAGRAGRGEKRGTVIIQTYNPDHYAIQMAIDANYEEFYNYEIKNRKELNYPPFGKIINIIVSCEDESKLENSAKEFYDDIKDILNESEKFMIYGPFKAPLYKINKRYRYQIFIKGDREQINIFKKKIRDILFKYNNKNDVRIVIDVDPINLM